MHYFSLLKALTPVNEEHTMSKPH